MDKERLLEEISDPNFDLPHFAAAAEKDKDFRDFIVNEMLTHPHIMVYYHCYYIAEAVCESSPDVMYGCWDGIEKLLKHKNSYHRNFALSLLARLSKVDSQNRMNGCIDDYLSLLDDVKFLTADTCIQNAALIAVYKPELSEKIVRTIIENSQERKRNVRQNSFLAGTAIEAFDTIYEKYNDKKQLILFAGSHLNGAGPKTRKTAKAFLKRRTAESTE